jgi:hypothetical protein
MIGPLPTRAGSRPATSTGMPHRQLDQQPADPGALAERVFGHLPAGVHEAPSAISVPGARALVLDDEVPPGPPEAFLVGREFAHLHPAPDHSLHLTLPVAVVREAVAAGWAEPHPAVAAGAAPPTAVLVYAPRDAHEVDVVVDLLEQSHRFARTPGGSP